MDPIPLRNQTPKFWCVYRVATYAGILEISLVEGWVKVLQLQLQIRPARRGVTVETDDVVDRAMKFHNVGGTCRLVQPNMSRGCRQRNSHKGERLC